jgi:hypothetical protein
VVVLVWAVLGAFSGVLVAVSAWGMVVGFVAVLSSEKLERCPRCGRQGLAQHGQMHADGCPPRVWQHYLLVPRDRRA